MRNALFIAVLASLGQAQAQQAPALPSVTIAARANEVTVEKPYRGMVRGMDLFERSRHRAPNAELRFKLIARQADTPLDQLELYVLGKTVEIPVPVAADRTFTVPRDAKALSENAVVSSDRKANSMTWRTDIRTPGLPPHTRRLGDLRLECQVGMEAGLYSGSNSAITRMFSAMSTTPAYCDRQDNRYYFFAERPLFGVTLTAGGRREALPVGRLYGSAIENTALKEELRWCDCAILVDRAYFLPLEDASWPDDTLVEMEFMDDPGPPLALHVPPGAGPGETVRFSNGYEVRAWRAPDPRRRTAEPEVVVLFDAAGVAQKMRVRPPGSR